LLVLGGFCFDGLVFYTSDLGIYYRA
jgi:hypothetical protein